MVTGALGAGTKAEADAREAATRAAEIFMVGVLVTCKVQDTIGNNAAEEAAMYNKLDGNATYADLWAVTSKILGLARSPSAAPLQETK